MIKKIQPPKPSIKRVKRRRRVRTAAGSASETETEDESTSSSDEEVIDQPVVEKPTLEPFIDSLFGGRLASFIVCDACHHVGSFQFALRKLIYRLGLSFKRALPRSITSDALGSQAAQKGSTTLPPN
jgi:hypothetical protein